MLGIDIVTISRFKNKDHAFFERFLSKEEISEFNMLNDDESKAKFAAVHWAIKEALYKANNNLAEFKNISITKKNNKYNFLDFEISTSDEGDLLVAIVQKK